MLQMPLQHADLIIRRVTSLAQSGFCSVIRYATLTMKSSESRLPPSQRRLLERLVALAASVVGSRVPLAAVTLETLGLLLEVLGEVPPETARLLRAPLEQKLTCHCSLLRMGVGLPHKSPSRPHCSA